MIILFCFVCSNNKILSSYEYNRTSADTIRNEEKKKNEEVSRQVGRDRTYTRSFNQSHIAYTHTHIQKSWHAFTYSRRQSVSAYVRTITESLSDVCVCAFIYHNRRKVRGWLHTNITLTIASVNRAIDVVLASDALPSPWCIAAGCSSANRITMALFLFLFCPSRFIYLFTSIRTDLVQLTRELSLCRIF